MQCHYSYNDLSGVHSIDCCFHFLFNHTATTEIYTLSLHDALPIRAVGRGLICRVVCPTPTTPRAPSWHCKTLPRSEEHTSELQSQSNLVCRLLLEKKKKQTDSSIFTQHSREARYRLPSSSTHL